MKRAAGFLVKKRYWILAFMTVLLAVSAFLVPQVTVNYDMTKYLPADSSMKSGIDWMEQEFPETEMMQTIQVMFQDLDAGEREEVCARLEAIPYVDSVDFEPDSEDYQKDPYTLYVVNTAYDYETEEESSIEKAIQDEFASYQMIFRNGDTAVSSIPAWIIAVAITILMVILFIMCSSWVEPVLFLITIGFAVVINLGTNRFLDSVSNITFSIAAILQLVLSMDYSIILMNRYRQELKQNDSRTEAMKLALANAFSSIASSSVTTIVGLLALVFMRFRIGMDLGVVLAKGVLISMLCIFTVLPGLILGCDKLIQKTGKRELPIRMNWLAAFSYRFRRVLAVSFVVLFVGAYFFQGNTKIAYTLEEENPIAEIFPASNAIVLLYENGDDDSVTKIAEELEQKPFVKSALSFSTTLGKPYRAEELADAIRDMTDEMVVDPSLLAILYYNYYTGGELPSIPLGEFLHFIAEDVVENQAFSEYMEGGIREEIHRIETFADAGTLTRPMNAAELADFLDIGEDEIRQLLLYYVIQNGGAETGTMTLPVFADFVGNEIASDEEYSSLLHEAALSQMQMLSDYTDAEKMTKRRSPGKISELLGVDPEMGKLLFVYYYASSDNYDPGEMTIPAFVWLIQEKVAQNPMFSAYFDEASLAQVKMLAQYTDRDFIERQQTGAELAAAIGMEESLVNQIFYLYYGGAEETQGMPLPEFTGFLVNHVLGNDAYAGYLDESLKAQLTSLNQLVAAAASGQEFSASQLSELTGLDAVMIENLFADRAAVSGQEVSAMTLPGFLGFVTEEVAADPQFSAFFDEETLTRLGWAKALAAAAASGQEWTAEELSRYLGIEEAFIRQVFQMKDASRMEGKTLSLEQMVDFLLSDVVTQEAFAPYFDEPAVQQLAFLQTIMKASLSGKTFDCAGMAQLTGMEESLMKMLYTYGASLGETGSWRLSMQTVVNFLADNKEAFRTLMGSKELDQVETAKNIINGSVDNTRYSCKEMADLLGMEKDQLNALYLLYISEHGDTSGWKLSVQKFVEFIVCDLLPDETFSGRMDGDSAEELKQAKTVIDAVVSGKAYTAEECEDLLAGFEETLNGSTMELLYLYYASEENSDPDWTLSIRTLFDYLSGDILTDPRFSDLLDDKFRKEIEDRKEEMDTGAASLRGPEHSLLMLNTTLPEESAETTAFFDELTGRLGELSGEYHLIGNSAMNYEMEKSFDREMTTITLLTAAAIFLVVALTFRSLIIPAILVCIVQCGVYLTITVIGLQGYSIYYLALLIVQCILMGATIDYGILFTNYYREKRQSMGREEVLAAAYNGSIHTILTSGLIMILVTGIVGYCFSNPTIGQICRTISIGALCATLLILFLLPGLLSTFDRIVSKK